MPEKSNPLEFFMQYQVGCNASPALSRIQEFGGMQAGGGDIAILQKAFALVARTNGMGTIIYYLKAIFSGYLLNSRYIAGVAKTCTGMIPTVLSVIRASIFPGSIFNVSGSMSQNTGVQFSHLMALTVAIQVKGVVIISPLRVNALIAI